MLENKIRNKMRELGWEAFMQSFGCRPDEDLRTLTKNGIVLDVDSHTALRKNELMLMAVLSKLGDSRMSLRFEDVGEQVVCEHKLWLLMEFLGEKPEYVPIVESRL